MRGLFSKRNLKLFLLDLVFTVLLIALLVSVRAQTRVYFDEINGLSPELAQIQQDLAEQNLSTYDAEYVESTLSSVERLASRSLFLNQVLFPLALVILWIVLQGLVWRSLSRVSFKDFIRHSLLPIVFFFAFVIYFLKYLSYIFYYDTLASLPILILIFLAFLISMFFSFISLSRSCSLKESFQIAKRHFRMLWLPFSLLFFSLFLYLLLVTLMFIFTYAGIGFSPTILIFPSVFLLLNLVVLNYQRISLVEKIQYLQ